MLGDFRHEELIREHLLNVHKTVLWLRSRRQHTCFTSIKDTTKAAYDLGQAHALLKAMVPDRGHLLWRHSQKAEKALKWATESAAQRCRQRDPDPRRILQGRYVGMMRWLPAKDKAYFCRIARKHGQQTAVDALCAYRSARRGEL